MRCVTREGYVWPNVSRKHMKHSEYSEFLAIAFAKIPYDIVDMIL